MEVRNQMVVEFEPGWIPNPETYGLKGNTAQHGKELIIRVKHAEAVTGQIRNERNQVQQVDQSFDLDEDNDAETINFSLKRRGWFGSKLPEGNYTLIVWWWDRDTGKAGGFKDQFQIAKI